MATVSAYITAQLAQYSLEIDTISMEVLLIDHDLTSSTAYSKEIGPKVKTALLEQVRGILASPDVTEGGLALKWDRASVQAYCTKLETELGLSTSSAPKVEDKSYLW